MSNDDRKARTHYIHRLSYTARERLVGAFVLLAVALIFLVLVFNQQTARYFQKKFVLHAYIHNAQGINTDTPVIVSGLDVGNVSQVGITPDNRIAISMKILEKYHRLIRMDSRAELSKLSVLGNTAIEISAGSPDKPLMPNNATVMLQEPLSVDQILAQVSPALDNVQAILARLNAIMGKIDPRKMQQIVNNLGAISANLKSVSQQMASGHGAIGNLLYAQKTENNLSGAIQSLNASLKNIEPLLRNASTASAQLPELVSHGKVLVGQLNTTVRGVNAQIESLPAMVLQTRKVLDDTDQTLRALQNTWPISSSVAKPPTKQMVPARPPND